jgi:hypothetical protein
VIGAGDCPYCGGDVVFDLRRDEPLEAPRTPDAERRRGLLRRLFGR